MDDVKTYGINAVLNPIVWSIKDLELEGIQEVDKFVGIAWVLIALILGYSQKASQGKLSMVSGT